MKNLFKSFKELYQRRGLLSFIFGFLSGAMVFLFIYGFKILNIRYTDWLLHSDDFTKSLDLTQHYLGFCFYRRTEFIFPYLGLTRGVYSDPISVIYTDSIPLFSFLFKILFPFIKEDIQYFGIFSFLSYGLTGGFSSLIFYKLNQIFLKEKNNFSLPFDIIGALFVSINPVLLNRTFLHTALSAHFLILFAFLIVLYSKDLKFKKTLLLFSVLLPVSSLINAYFVPMIFIILLLFLLHKILNRSINLKCAFILISLPTALMLFFCFIFGMFYGHVPSSDGGLNAISFNLLSFFNPFTYVSAYKKYSLNYDEMMYGRLLPPLPLTNFYQNEGFSYLGFSVIIMFLISIIFLCFKLFNKIRKKESLRKDIFIPVLLFIIIFLLLAMSPVWTLGSHSIFSLYLPDLFIQLWSSFRSTARFIWPLYYAVLIMSVFITGYILRDNFKLKIIIFSLLFLLQLYDLSPGILIKKEAFFNISAYETSLKSDEWDEIAKGKTRIVFYPPTMTGLYLDKETCMDFSIYALKYGLYLNNSYLSRNLTDASDERTYEEFKGRKENEEIHPDTIYVFFDCLPEDLLPDADEYHLKYMMIDDRLIAVDK